MKTIIVPTDFSGHSANALRYAASIADRSQARLVLFHAYHVPVSFAEVPVPIIAEHTIEAEAYLELKRMANQVQKDIGKFLHIECINREGLLVDTMKDFIAENKADLIVMGTQGASGMEEMLLGSHSAYIMENAACPVLIIPANAVFSNPKKIMYATDFQFKDFACINQLAEIARLYDAEIAITHISTDPEKGIQEEAQMDWFKEIAETNITYPKITFHTFPGENVMEKLQDAVKDLGVDMLCMATVKRNFLEKLFRGSITKKMAYHTQVPLLAFHINRANRL